VPLPPGPKITYFGIVTADNRETFPIGETLEGVPIFERPFGQNFLIVVEARPGASNRPLSLFGTDQFPASGSRAAFMLRSSNNLGNGSAEVCDEGPTLGNPNQQAGGVPGQNPPQLDDSQETTDAINDFACRFVFHNVSTESCTFNMLGNFAFLREGQTTGQFCSGPAVGNEIAFPAGQDTTLLVQLRDSQGNLGDQQRIVVRVQ
jgi:hypothetical protein